jgi:hypothetical protein
MGSYDLGDQVVCAPLLIHPPGIMWVKLFLTMCLYKGGAPSCWETVPGGYCRSTCSSSIRFQSPFYAFTCTSRSIWHPSLQFTHDMIGCPIREARCAEEIPCGVICLEQASSEVYAFVLFIWFQHFRQLQLVSFQMETVVQNIVYSWMSNL